MTRTSITVDLAGKVALVTGASSGFGRRFARVLAANGARVYAAARRRALLDTLVEEIKGDGGEAIALTLDVADEENVAEVFGQLEQIDIVVNNAGVGSESKALDCGEVEWRRTYDINVHGSWFVAQHAARRLVSRGAPGSIINIASITAERPGVSATPYSSSKAAVVQMTKSLAMEWARHGIRVNALAPGYFDTDLASGLLYSDYGRKMLSRIPQRRFGELSDLDGPLLLLASDASAYITGAVIAIDGGHLCSPL